MFGGFHRKNEKGSYCCTSNSSWSGVRSVSSLRPYEIRKRLVTLSRRTTCKIAKKNTSTWYVCTWKNDRKQKLRTLKVVVPFPCGYGRHAKISTLMWDPSANRFSAVPHQRWDVQGNVRRGAFATTSMPGKYQVSRTWYQGKLYVPNIL